MWQSYTIASAKTIKDTGAFVYTIAVVNDADPDESINTSTETNINAYLHSVSRTIRMLTDGKGLVAVGAVNCSLETEPKTLITIKRQPIAMN